MEAEQVPVSRLEPKARKGLVVVITGHGKGKTTTALGLAWRACGHGLRICLIQFMKGDLYAGEWDGVQKMACPVELIAGVGAHPDQAPLYHLVLTGRNAAPEVMALADTVSEIREIKHAYRQGIEPQPGIDY